MFIVATNASSSLALASDVSVPSGSSVADESLSLSTEDELLLSSSSDLRGLISKEDEECGDDGDGDDDDDSDGVKRQMHFISANKFLELNFTTCKWCVQLSYRICRN